MKFKAMFGCAVAGCVAAAAPAHAQTQSGDDSWTGPYIGGSLGLGLQPKDRSETLVFDTGLDGSFGDTVRTGAGANAFSPGFCGGAALGRTPAEGCRGDRDGTEYFARAGYDFQSGAFVFGVVVDGGKSESRDSVTGYSTTPAFYTLTRQVDYGFGARARAGVAVGRTLVYGTGGAAWARLQQELTTSNGANSFNGNTLVDRRKTSAWGWSAGGGAEVKVARNFSIGAEYLYTRYRDDEFDVRVGPGTAPATNPFLLANAQGTDLRRSDRDFDTHGVRVTAAFRF